MVSIPKLSTNPPLCSFSLYCLLVVCLFSCIGNGFAWSFPAGKGLSLFCPTPADIGLERLRPLASSKLRLRMKETDNDTPADMTKMPTPPPFDPSALMPPFGQPGRSRYEQFYKSSGDAIDADAEAVGEEGETASNPFYVGYEEDELAALWAVHETNFGAYDGQDDDQQATNNLSPGGGLHDLVRAIGEGEPMNIGEIEPKELAKLIQAQEQGALGLDELILAAREQAVAEQASGGNQQATTSSPVGGLHELVLEAIGESKPKEDAKFASRASRTAIILGLDELIQETRDQADAEQASAPLGLHELILEACAQADAEQKATTTDDSEPKETK